MKDEAKMAGARWDPAHERWVYDGVRRVQTLKRLIR